MLLQGWAPSRPVEVVTPNRTVRCGSADGEAIRWASTDFEVLRARLGRRSQAELAAMDWSQDPGSLLDELAVFTPAEADIDE